MLQYYNPQQVMHSMHAKYTAQIQGHEKTQREKEKTKMLMRRKFQLFMRYCQMPTHTHQRLTILVLTSFSIALTSSAALGTSVEPCREASNAEDCKSPASA